MNAEFIISSVLIQFEPIQLKALTNDELSLYISSFWTWEAFLYRNLKNLFLKNELLM